MAEDAAMHPDNLAGNAQLAESVALLEDLMIEMEKHGSNAGRRGVNEMLRIGCGTAVTSVCELIKDVDRWLDCQDCSTSEKVAIIKESHGMVLDVTKMSVASVDDVFGTGDSLVYNYPYERYDPVTKTSPSIFAEDITRQGKRRVRFSDGFREYLNDKNEEACKTYEVAQPGIGCPILLTPKLTEAMWRWGVEMSEKAELIGK